MPRYVPGELVSPDRAPDIAVLTMSSEAHLRACRDHSLVDYFAVVAPRIRHRVRGMPVQFPTIALDEVRFALLHLLEGPPQVGQINLLALKRVCVSILSCLGISRTVLVAVMALGLM